MVECLLFIGAGSRSRSKTDRLRNTAGGLCPPRVCEHASASFIIFLTLILFLFGDKNSKFRPKFLALLICRILFALCLVQLGANSTTFYLFIYCSYCSVLPQQSHIYIYSIYSQLMHHSELCVDNVLSIFCTVIFKQNKLIIK